MGIITQIYDSLDCPLLAPLIYRVISVEGLTLMYLEGTIFSGAEDYLQSLKVVEGHHPHPD